MGRGKEDHHCETCEQLKLIIDCERHDKNKILQSLLDLQKPIVVNEERHEVPQDLYRPKLATWNTHRELLETEDKKKAQLIKQKLDEAREAAKTTEQLEKELIEDAN